MSARDLSPREDVKFLTALLADHAEDTMDADDVDQVRAEIIEHWDRLERGATYALALLRGKDEEEPDEENVLRAIEALEGALARLDSGDAEGDA